MRTQRNIILWSHPRSRSTAFERAFIEREDCFVVHEPASLARYFGSNLDKILYELEMVSKNQSLQNLHQLNEVCYKGKNAFHTFTKDFAYHYKDNLSDRFLKGFQHTFLVRDPEEAIRSFYNIHPSFKDWEAGYIELLQLLKKVCRISQAPTYIINAKELVTAPAATMQKYCQAIGLTYCERMVFWGERQEINSWDHWKPFHTTALHTRSFSDVKTPPCKSHLPKERQHLIKTLKPIYEEICSFNETINMAG